MTAVPIGVGGLLPPTTFLDNDGLTSYDPAHDGIDFYESLEGMRVQVNDGRVVRESTVINEYLEEVFPDRFARSGRVDAPVLGGTVTVHDALYTRGFDPNSIMTLSGSGSSSSGGGGGPAVPAGISWR